MRKLFLKPPIFFYEKIIKERKEGVSFIIFSFFLLSFVISRTYVYLSVKGFVPETWTVNVRGVHIHHFAYGFLLTGILGYLALTLPRKYFEAWKIKLAALFGIGLGLTFDEFGMWLKLEDEYWLRQSYDAIIIISIIFINIVYFGNFWRKLGSLLIPKPT